jgi:competence/damage-inducible protein CinA-like protein
MPTAELIAIGTELLLGEIQDTNTRYLARALRDLGVNLYRATITGDNTARIAGVIREAMARCQIIITTGGLGPTVDDPTRAAVAQALDVDVEFRPELWEQIQARFERFGRTPSDNNRRQAWIPAGSIPVENPVGTAPAFICESANACIICLPGVPREMEYLTQNVVLPYLRDRFQLSGTIKARVLHVAGVGESTIDDWIGDLETSTNPTVGLLAHPGQVDIRITASAESVV